jgi:hypothetical protein
VAAGFGPWPEISGQVKTFGLAVFSEYVEEVSVGPAVPVAAEYELGAVAEVG